LRDRLGSRLNVLRSGARDLPARQQTLRATIEWSYQLLEPAEQRLLELLSVFASASVDAIESIGASVESVAGTELDVLDGLGSLLDKSLLRQPEPDAAGVTRITLLETIREYAGEQLDGRPELATACREQHARYFSRLAADAWAEVSGSDGEATIDRLAVDVDNLRSAWRHWVGEGDLDRLNEMLDGLWSLYEARGWYHAVIELINELLGVLSTTPPNDQRWRQELTLRTSLARALTLLRGYTGEVEDAYGQALALFEGHREVPQLLPVLRGLASFHGFRGDSAKAAEYAAEILRLGEQENDRSVQVDGHFLLGSYMAFLGEPEAGLRHLETAVELSEGTGHRPRRLRLGIDARVACLTTSGFLLWLLGYPDRAVERADRAVTRATEFDHPYSLAYALFHSGFAHLWRREPERVRDRASAAVKVAEASDLPIWRALGTCLLGAATSALGRPDEGLQQIADGIDQYQGLRTPPVFWPFILFMQAEAHVDARTPRPGLGLIDQAVEIGDPDQLMAPLFHVVRGDLLLALPEPDIAGATTAFERGLAVARRYGIRMLELRAAVRLCRVASGSDRAARIDAVRAVYATMTEGFTTPDLIDAAALLG
jgi:predicted ATPase